MKTLRHHVILYDAECPMCSLYTTAFVKAGMLDTDGRAAYQQMPSEVCSLVDQQRAVNEIALVDTRTGEVKYGIDSLCAILGHSYGFLGTLFNFPLVRFLLKKSYAFVSYNRRVIIPTDIKSASFSIQPSFKLKYRLLYLLFTWWATAFILSRYSQHLGDLLPVGNAWREYFICGGQILFQGMILWLYKPGQLWDYLGNMMTISFAGALLLLVAMGLLKMAGAGAFVFALCFMGVAGLMFAEHIRRSRLLHIGCLPTIGWVFYRIIVLLLILMNLL